MLDKADNAPITDVTQSKEEAVNDRLTSSKTMVKGINLSGYAALVKQANDSARQAITGVQNDNKANGKRPTRPVDGLVW
jgi:hypothetical protein